jgi:hypothetical protein
MSLSEGISSVDEEGGVEEDEGVLDWPDGHGLWSSWCRGWMARGPRPMPLAVFSPDLAQRPSFWLFRHIQPSLG